MTQALKTRENTDIQQWMTVCTVTDIFPNTGVCALVEGQQVAIFRVQTNGEDKVFALSNYDPFSKANVLSRGILGDRQGVIKVASPIYKQNFNLATGECLDDESVSVPSYPVQIVDGNVQIGV
ncbi:assimilatory nitrite reductase (NAD(P)H) small subunit [[Leptolyngbya] sp. PCC 7376]|uniref:nitrite reductase small subunit NirD n=1 Tax=[Leptolyngbya] sp. PCC 7376 TaxID=111781 RepID=UPI00029EFC30|nr:nitrite reductase small subunit NirD [[Leptolyngbya] sp. PCC 7376]AFY37437.1 assimilatory nitrite reductase (NAD(P)H) small subunit [[Leptolyngbya] sp. PCC 7376]